MSHYIDTHLEGKSIGTLIVCVCLNELLNDNSKSNVDNLMSNIYKIIEKCKRVEVRNIFVSGLVCTARVSLPILERIHKLVSHYCREHACFYVDSRNIWGFFLKKDGLHLLQSGKKTLAKNFIVIFFFLDSAPKYYLRAWDTNQVSIFSPWIRYKRVNSIDWST